MKVSSNRSRQSHAIRAITLAYTVIGPELPVMPKSALAMNGAGAPPTIVASVRLSDAPL